MPANPIVKTSLILEGAQKRFELLAGIVDAAVPLEEAAEELCEETDGFDGDDVAVVPLVEVTDELCKATERVDEDKDEDALLARRLVPGTYSDADVATALEVVGVITGGELDGVGIARVLTPGYEVVETVASGPMLTGTLKIAQISAMAANVSS